MVNPAISLHNLSKSYGKLTALKNITLHISPGEAYGLIGPNGAGKTTMIMLLRCSHCSHWVHLSMFFQSLAALLHLYTSP